MSGTRDNQPDVVVIGGGIAGVSIGAHLADAGLSVVLLEMEAALAHHTTGRSAAQFIENYGGEAVRRLTVSSRSFLTSPPEDYADRGVLTPRALLKVGREGRVDELRAEVEYARTLVPSTEFVDGATARQILPILREDVAGALYEPESMDIDVAELHQIYVRWLRARGGLIRTASPATAIEPDGTGWHVHTPAERFSTALVVNAAGAWSDRVAAMAGVDPIGVTPLRRTVGIAAIPVEFDTERWPLTSFEPNAGPMVGYIKPEPGGLLVSPADETPSDPCDAKPEELDVARGLAVLEEWTTLSVGHVRATWAGLRTFAADRVPVAGFAPEAPGFFWLAGQGGYGIQTAEGMAVAARGLIVDGALPDSLVALGLRAVDLDPSRSTLRGPLTEG